MDTAKVDIKKLQLLNDRISQCIDALNQVRLSVHGLSHSTATGQGIGAQQIGAGLETGPQGYGAGFGVPQGAAPWTSGLAHSALGYGQPGFGPQFGLQPMPQMSFAQPNLGVAGFAPPFGSPIGLSHTSLDVEAYNRPVWSDPFLAAKVAQTFPYARYAVPPLVSIY